MNYSFLYMVFIQKLLLYDMEISKDYTIPSFEDFVNDYKNKAEEKQ